MNPTPAFRSTFYLLEGIAVIILTASLLAAPHLGAVATLVLILAGLFWRRARQASWFALVALALFGMVADPTQTDPYVLGLAGISILFNSGLLGKNPLGYGIAVIVLTVLCQGLGLAWNADEFPQNLFPVLAIDAVLALLALVYTKQFMGLEPAAPRKLPVLDLAERDLSEADSALLRLFSESLSNRDLAAALGRSEGTVRNSLSRLYRELGVTNAKELQRFLHIHQVRYVECQPPGITKQPPHL